LIRALLILAALLIAPAQASAQQARKPVAKAAPRAAAARPAAPRPWAAIIVRTPEGGYRQGNPAAPIKLVEYGSRSCPICGQFANEGVPKLRDRYIASGKVSYEYRDFLVHGAPDFALALLNQCVPTTSFFRVLDAIYANQAQFVDKIEANHSIDQRLKDAKPGVIASAYADAMGIIPFMAKFGVPAARARQCLADPKLGNGIAKTYADGANLHRVRGTPTFILNGNMLTGFRWSEIEAELVAAGANS
jgi:protein-disulfide isomerase